MVLKFCSSSKLVDTRSVASTDSTKFLSTVYTTKSNLYSLIIRTVEAVQSKAVANDIYMSASYDILAERSCEY